MDKSKNYEPMDMWQILWRYRSKILLGTILVTVLTAIASLLMPNYYESASLFYPVHQNLQKPIVDAEDPKLYYYGNDSDVDRLLSIAQSDDLIQQVIRQKGLMAHYGIDSTNTKASLKVTKRFRKLYHIHQTEYDAIRLTIEDKDPKAAREINATVVELINQKATDVAMQYINGLREKLKSEIAYNTQKIDTLKQRIKKIKKQYNIYDTESQGESLGLLESKRPNSAPLQKRINQYAQGIDELRTMQAQLTVLNNTLSYDLIKLNKLESNSAIPRQAIHIIESPTYPKEKSRPRRSLYVLSAALMSMIVISMALLVRSRFTGHQGSHG